MTLASVPGDANGRIGDCTALKLRRTTRRLTQIYDDALAPHRVTVGQLGILAGLQRSRGIAIGELAERLSTDVSTLSRLLGPLKAAVLLSVETDPDDRRAKLLRLTEAGAAKVHAAAPSWQAAQDRVADLLSRQRLAALQFILDDAFGYL